MSEYQVKSLKVRGLKRIFNGVLRRVIYLTRLLPGLPVRLMSLVKSRYIQYKLIRQLGWQTCDKLVVFFIPDRHRVSGGVLQIFTLHRLTKDFFKNTNTDSVICWIPGEGAHLHHKWGFNNNVTIFPLKMVLNKCQNDCELMFHLPEYAAVRIISMIGNQRLAVLRKNNNLKLNILNQNIERMVERSQLDKIKKAFPDLTSTAGNPSWASEDERKRLNIPIYVLPTWYYFDDAPWQAYETKKNLMIVSPDKDPNRELVLGKLRMALPELEIRIIDGIEYEQYLELERSAKWSLTFGEGLDGYFYGPVFRGGVAFAVRNGTFDLPGLENIKTVYQSYEIMAERIAADICSLDNKEAYEAHNLLVRKPLHRAFSRDNTSESLAVFYKAI